MLTREQVRMARAALQWGVRELADRAGVTANTVSRFENGAGAQSDTLERIERALKDAGIIFIAENGEGPGVRLAKRVQSSVRSIPMKTYSGNNGGEAVYPAPPLTTGSWQATVTHPAWGTRSKIAEGATEAELIVNIDRLLNDS